MYRRFSQFIYFLHKIPLVAKQSLLNLFNEKNHAIHRRFYSLTSDQGT
jgi:hypothetical protein